MNAKTVAPAHIGRVYLFALLGWTFDFYDLVLLGFIKNEVARDLHLSPTAIAWILGIALGASGIGGIAAGRLADRLGKRTILAWTVAIYSLGSLVCGLAPNAVVFAAGRAIVGLGVGGEWAIGHAMLAESVAAARRGAGQPRSKRGNRSASRSRPSWGTSSCRSWDGEPSWSGRV